ncbi:hypothetical protein CBM2587_A160423 [Cupriavidus taiwanensis]|uniref:Uncharacterized protein n=1 Tax=Cupriavidus taiwanensis TaxID=164546 RepID=A0A975WW44_9BURK|nr:hypothetical protein CBM2587_A160423 [Cupriavidus taiwanensis]
MPKATVTFLNMEAHQAHRFVAIASLNGLNDCFILLENILRSVGIRAKQGDSEEDDQVVDLTKHPNQLGVAGCLRNEFVDCAGGMLKFHQIFATEMLMART